MWVACYSREILPPVFLGMGMRIKMTAEIVTPPLLIIVLTTDNPMNLALEERNADT